MGSIKDIMRVRDAGQGNIPDVSNEGIDASAKLVWTAVMTAVQKQDKVTEMNGLSGQPGYLWQGAVNAIINDLWPALSDSYLVSRDQAEDVKLALNRYLRFSGNLICRRRLGRHQLSIWWVSQHWAGVTFNREEGKKLLPEQEEMSNVMTTTKAADPFDLSVPFQPPAGVVAAEAQAEDTDEDSEKLVCRHNGCGREFDYHQIRASHEKTTHGLRVMADGTHFTFDINSKVTDAEVAKLILELTVEAKGPETFNYFHHGIQERDPRVSKYHVKRVLESLTEGDDPQLKVIDPNAYYIKYTLVSWKRAESIIDGTTSKPEPTAEPATERVEALAEALAEVQKPEPQHTEDETKTSLDAGPAEGHRPSPSLVAKIAMIGELTKDLQRLAILERRRESDVSDFQELQRKNQELGVEVSNLETMVETLQADLRAVTLERDELKQTLDGIRKQLGIA